jgi:putative transposase
MFRQKMEYMLFNPVERGYVSFPEHWLFSSARNYILDDDSVIAIQKPALM